MPKSAIASSSFIRRCPRLRGPWRYWLRVAPFRREEQLRQLFQVFVFFQVIFQFIRIRRVTS